MPARLGDADFLHSIECLAARQRDRKALDPFLDVVDIRDLDEDSNRRALRPARWNAEVLLDTLPGLLHQFCPVLGENHGAELVVSRHVHRLVPAEAVHPDREARFDCLDHEDGGEFLCGCGWHTGHLSSLAFRLKDSLNVSPGDHRGLEKWNAIRNW